MASTFRVQYEKSHDAVLGGKHLPLMNCRTHPMMPPDGQRASLGVDRKASIPESGREERRKEDGNEACQGL